MFPGRVPVVATDDPGNKFVSTWLVPTGDKTLTLPFIDDSNTINFTIDWGDGNLDVITAHDDADLAHTYGSGGTYTIIMDGTISGFQFDNGGDKTQITNISNWGSLNLSVPSAFFGCTNLAVTATDAPTITATNLQETFKNCEALASIGNANGWDTSSVTNLSSFLMNAPPFNQDLSSWDVSEVTNFSSMFHSTAFNHNISSWDVAKATHMAYMFAGCTAFNQPIGVWDTGEVTTMAVMFYGATSFNQDISNFDIAKTTTMSQMFETANALSTANYDALLIAWEGQTEQASVTFHAGDAVMTTGGTAEAARDALVANGWTITDSTGTHT